MDYPQRKKNRLKNFDYSTNGAYYITICTNDKKCILSKVEYKPRRDRACPCPQVVSTQLGKICTNTIDIIENMYSVSITDFIIMPNHIHLIIYIDDIGRTGASPVPTISSIIGTYKSLVSVEWLKVCKNNNREMGKLWERSFYDHIIRDDEDYYFKARYIEKNHIRWCDKHNMF